MSRGLRPEDRERLRQIGREHRERWQERADQDADHDGWARALAGVLDLDALVQLQQSYARLARRRDLEPEERAEARRRVKALEWYTD